MSYDPHTGLYDVPTTTNIVGSIVARKAVNNGTNFYNPATNAYDILPTSTTGTCGSATCYYNPVSKLYDLTAAYALISTNSLYYYDPATGQYSIPMYNGTNYYDPASQTYIRTSAYPTINGNMVYDPISGKYDIAQVNASGQFYNPATGTYQASAVSLPGTLYYNPTTGNIDLGAPYTVTGNYALATNMDPGGTSYNYSVVGALAGSATNQSIFTGLGHTIDGLTITGSTGVSTQTSGLFGTVTSSTLRDLGLTNVNINVSLPIAAGASAVGALAGSVAVTGTAPSIVYNVYSTGTLTSGQKDANGNFITGKGFVRVGGLIGNDQGNSNTPVINTVTNAFSTVSVLADNNSTVGGLIGTANTVAVANAHATGNVQGGVGGGLAGGIGGQVSDSYATGTVTVKNSGGGLIASYGSTTGGLSNSFATGDVFGGSNNGGLIGTVGFSDGNLVISNVYATGDVYASSQSVGLNDPGAGEGGLIGVAAGTSTFHLKVTNAHATGNVIAALNYGGLSNPDLTSGFGGLVGQFNDPNGGSLIENSYATGAVDASRPLRCNRWADW